MTLGSLSDKRFQIRVSALLDLYTTLSEASKAQQNLQLLPWERLELHHHLLEELGLKQRSLPRVRKAGAVTPGDIQELLAEVDPDDMPNHWPNLSEHKENLSQSQVRTFELAGMKAFYEHASWREALIV